MGRWLNLELLDSTGTPFRQRPFVVAWPGGRAEGITNVAGQLAVVLPAGVERATLTVAWRTFELDFGLAPVDEVDGAQARLNQLNFACGPVDGVLGPRTEDALRRFQILRQLPVTGMLDDATCARLVEDHGT